MVSCSQNNTLISFSRKGLPYFSGVYVTSSVFQYVFAVDFVLHF